MIDNLLTLNPYIVGVVVIILVCAFFIAKSKKKTHEIQPATATKLDNKYVSMPDRESAIAGGYKAYVWKPGRMTLEVINEPIGNELVYGAGMPMVGSAFSVLVDADGKRSAFDHRLQAVVAGETPVDLHEAVECKEVEHVYVDYSSLWEKFQAMIPYLIAGAEALILLVLADKVGGG